MPVSVAPHVGNAWLHGMPTRDGQALTDVDEHAIEAPRATQLSSTQRTSTH